jgi:hypothetical protein
MIIVGKILLVYARKNYNFNPFIIVGRNGINGGLYGVKYSGARLAGLVDSNGVWNFRSAISVSAVYSSRNLSVKGGKQLQYDENENKGWKKKLHIGCLVWERRSMPKQYHYLFIYI